MAFDRQQLHFREVEESDLPMLRAWRNDPKMSAGWHSPDSVQTSEQQMMWYESLNAKNQAYLACINVQNEPSKPDMWAEIGMLRFRLHGSEARITGIDVAAPTQGKGYGTRILRAGAEYTLWDLGYHRATGEALATNKAAQKIILKAGFKQEGTLRQYVWRAGKWEDWYIYSLLRDELWREESGVAAG